MENKAHYFLVGLFALILSAGAILFGAWIMGGGEYNHYRKIVVYVPGQVSGLNEGSAVKYRGVQIGRIDKILLDSEMPQYVKILAGIDPNVVLREDVKATLQSVGVTGLTYLELEGQSDTAAILQPPPGKDYLVIYAEESGLAKLFKELPEMVESYSKVADQLLVLFNNQNIASASHTLQNFEKFSENISAHQKEINRILDETQQTLEKFEKFSTSSFNELNYFLRDSRLAAIEIKNLTKSLQENPSRVLYQPKYDGYEVKE